MTLASTPAAGLRYGAMGGINSCGQTLAIQSANDRSRPIPDLHELLM